MAAYNPGPYDPPLADPRRRPQAGPSPSDPLANAAALDAVLRGWLVHAATASAPMSEEARAGLLANERILLGRQRTIID